MDSPEKIFREHHRQNDLKARELWYLDEWHIEKSFSNPDIAGLSLADGKKSAQSISAAKADGYISPKGKGHVQNKY